MKIGTTTMLAKSSLSCFLALNIGLMAHAQALNIGRMAHAQEKLPPGTSVVRIEAQPATITLKTPYAYAQLLVTAHLNTGDRVDVTRMVQMEPPANLVKVSPMGQVRPQADGTGPLKINLAGKTATIPITV